MPETITKPTSSIPPVELTYSPPARRSLRKRLRWAFHAWATDTFSRDSIVASLKSLLWVAPLTALIWIYAEREQDVAPSGLPVTINVRSAEPGRVARLVSGNLIHVDLKGRQADVELVKDYLETTPVTIEVPSALGPGEQTIFLKDDLDHLAPIVSHGVTITSCAPSGVVVDVDVVVSREAEVKLRPEDANKFTAVFTPAKVRVTGPRHVLARAGKDLVAYADLSAAAFKQQLAEPGKHSLSNVSVTLPAVPADAPHVDIEPRSISAEVDVTNKAESTITLPYLRVLAAYRPDAGAKADQYKPFYDPTITNVTVTGPEQQIAQLQDPNAVLNPAPAAIFEVNFSDVDNPRIEAPIMYQLPPGVHVSEQDAARKITYSLKPRATEPQ